MKRRGMGGVLIVATGLAVSATATDERFPFVIPGDDATPTATDFSGLNARPAGAAGFVRITDGHLATDAGRLRIWGVNICASANFPAHADAEVVAAHLAKLGINGVRMHHHDSQPPPRGILLPPEHGRRELDPEMLDRQDYFLVALQRHGIYANLNLHVGRTFTEAEGFVSKNLPRDFRYDKFLIYFEPRMRAQFKGFCRAYLGHVNPYRQLRRADDPGIAMIEITNENSFHTLGLAGAAKLPEPYRGEFLRQWNVWLAQHYRSTDDLRRAWAAGYEQPGAEMCKLDGAAAHLGAWRLHSGHDGKLRVIFGEPGPSPDRSALRVVVEKTCTGVGQELMFSNLKLEAGRSYTVSFYVRGSQSRPLRFDVSRQGRPDWRAVGLSGDVSADQEWQHVERTFRASETPEGGGRLCFKFPGHGDLWLAEVRLRTGGPESLAPPGQTLEARNIGLPPGSSEPALADLQHFMTEVEIGFIRELVMFLKKDLGVRVPITASQITYHGAAVVAATCDYTDIHAYWQHPHFPGQPWDSNNWTVANTPMEQAPTNNVLFERATWRIFGRPFTMSEWNIPSPNDYAASCVPFAALTASLQDWDGVFFFTYNSKDENWRTQGLESYFSFVGQPVKLATLAAGANLFRRGDLAPLPLQAAGTCETRLAPGLAMGRQLGINPQATAPDAVPAIAGQRLTTPDGSVLWDATDTNASWVQITTPASRMAWGMIAGRTLNLAGLCLEVGPVERNYGVISIASLDGQPLEQSKHMLLTAVGSAENSDMVWNAARTSVGRNWGHGPAQVNGLTATITLSNRVTTVQALDGTGRPQSSVDVERAGPASRWTISPRSHTLWYAVTAE